MTTQTQQSRISHEEFGIQLSDANKIQTNLQAVLAERQTLAEQYAVIIRADIDHPNTAKQASSLRKLVKDNRTKGIEAWHKREKEVYLRVGQFIDAVKRKEVAVNEEMEENLLKIEKHQELLERARIVAVGQERALDLSTYCDDYDNLPEPKLFELGAMSELDYITLFNNKVSAYQERIEAEKRIALHKERKETLLPYWHVLTAEERAFDYAEVLDFEEFLNGAVTRDRDAKESAEKAREEARLLREKMEAEAKKQKEALSNAKAEAEAERAKAAKIQAEFEAAKASMDDYDEPSEDEDEDSSFGEDLEADIDMLFTIYDEKEVAAYLLNRVCASADIALIVPAGNINRDSVYKFKNFVETQIKPNITGVYYE